MIIVGSILLQSVVHHRKYLTSGGNCRRPVNKLSLPLWGMPIITSVIPLYAAIFSNSWKKPIMLSAPSPPYRFTVANLVAKKWSNSCGTSRQTHLLWEESQLLRSKSDTFLCVVGRPYASLRRCSSAPSWCTLETDVTSSGHSRNAWPRTPGSSGKAEKITWVVE